MTIFVKVRMTKKGGKKKLRGQLFWNRIELFNTSSIPLLITLSCNICKMDVIPLVFSPYSVNAEVKFKDLSKHSFTAKEKLWMCEELEGLHDETDDTIVSIEEAADRYYIPLCDMAVWLSRYRRGQDQVNNHYDSPVDDDGVARITNYVNNSGVVDGVAPNQDDMKGMLYDVLAKHSNPKSHS